MIYDSKETFMEIENLLHIEDNSVVAYDVDYEGIEDGRRYLGIPPGVESICAGSFSEYNCSDLAASLSRNLIMPEQYINQWAKRLSVKSGIKIQFPAEVGKSVRKRAEYMVEKERRVRFLRLDLPASLTGLTEDSFPILLEEINVSAENKSFMSADGVMFSKDMKTLIRYPGYKNTETYEIPEGVEVISEGAFGSAFVNNLVLPETIRNIAGGAFRNAVIGRLEIKEGLAVIEEETFVNCDIKEIVLPLSIKVIKDYAFRGTSGIKKFICESEELTVGYGVFSGGNFADIKWWPWETIPKATFINARIKSLNIPEGVKTIGDYAFAGCYTAEEIIIPQSVKEIDKWSFDEGATFSADVTLPETLYKYVYRFPALSRINKKQKSEIWRMSEEKNYCEEIDVLQRQKECIEKYIESLRFLQNLKKTIYVKELNLIEELIKGR